MTISEKNFRKRMKAAEEKRIEMLVNTTHRERVNKFNQKLGSQMERAQEQ